MSLFFCKLFANSPCESSFLLLLCVLVVSFFRVSFGFLLSWCVCLVGVFVFVCFFVAAMASVALFCVCRFVFSFLQSPCVSLLCSVLYAAVAVGCFADSTILLFNPEFFL